MRLLLDENLPKRLKKEFKEFEIFTIHERGWSGKSNGLLMQLMVTEKFDVLITFDKNMQYQQNFTKYSLTVIVLNAKDNSFDTLKNLVPEIKKTLSLELKPGPTEIKE